MNSQHDLSEDPAMRRVVMEYLGELESGRRPDRAAFIGRFPELGPALEPYLDALDAVQLLHVPTSRPEPLPAAQVAEPLGDFRILREIGRGGMGVVYEALQLSLGRRVALKVLPFAAALDSRQLQRFKNEAQAAAQLHHPNVVPVYFVGCERGVHYYAMQLIDGQNLASLIDSVRQAGQSPPDAQTAIGARLSTQRSQQSGEFFRGVARLLVQAAEGLDYAHGLGIVHRDVKPANVLLDGEGHVWVTDFGLAQFQQNAALTQTGDVLGTLRYLSPEQANPQGKMLDARTDVYSLGATLYEAITLTPIFAGHDRQGLLHQILNEEPRPPRAIDSRIPDELETIALKALNKNPAERYASAREFASDLNRFLRDEPILARRVTPIQKMTRWIRKRPAILYAGVVLLVLATLGSLTSAALLRAEQAKTALALKAEQQRAEETEQQFRLARRSVDEMIRLAEEETTADPHLRKRLLEAAAVYYQEFIERKQDDTQSQTELKTTRDRVKQILDDLAVLQGTDQLALLQDRDVLDELGLSAEQRTKVAALSARLAEQRTKSAESLRGLTLDERRGRLAESARANEAAAVAILSAEQMLRLRQVALQLQGPFAFRRPEVITALRLSTEQREQIWATGPPGPMGKFDRPMPPRKGERKHPHEFGPMAAMERIIGLLSEEQRLRWGEMTGKPFARLHDRGPPPRF